LHGPRRRGRLACRFLSAPSTNLLTPRLRRAQRRRDARVQLRAAAEIFDRLDARPWTECARAELRATGETMTSVGNGGEQLTLRNFRSPCSCRWNRPTPR
jgi:hypothetical protein